MHSPELCSLSNLRHPCAEDQQRTTSLCSFFVPPCLSTAWGSLSARVLKGMLEKEWAQHSPVCAASCLRESDRHGTLGGSVY